MILKQANLRVESAAQLLMTEYQLNERVAREVRDGSTVPLPLDSSQACHTQCYHQVLAAVLAVMLSAVLSALLTREPPKRNFSRPQASTDNKTFHSLLSQSRLPPRLAFILLGSGGLRRFHRRSGSGQGGGGRHLRREADGGALARVEGARRAREREALCSVLDSSFRLSLR